MAVRNSKDRQPWQTDHHPDGQLYYGLFHLQLVDTRLLLRSRKRQLEIPSRISDLLLCPRLSYVSFSPRLSPTPYAQGET
ncbi:hypothetical protein LB505_012524 [Fusarium chuoi]|nr:hypothetical protein LB505_012524 [Fusarium chuoi]